jgi:hypothetical protein
MPVLQELRRVVDSEWCGRGPGNQDKGNVGIAGISMQHDKPCEKVSIVRSMLVVARHMLYVVSHLHLAHNGLERVRVGTL